jgi:hypothetical protein
VYGGACVTGGSVFGVTGTIDGDDGIVEASDDVVVGDDVVVVGVVPPKAPSPEPATSVAPKLCGVRNPRRCRELCGSKWIRRPCSRLHRRSGSCPANRHRTRRLGFPLPRMMMTRRRPIGHRSIG